MEWKLFILSVEGTWSLMIFKKREYYTIVRNTGPAILFFEHLILLMIQTMLLIIFGCGPDTGRMDQEALPYSLCLQRTGAYHAGQGGDADCHLKFLQAL